MNPEKYTIMSFDTKIRSVNEYTQDEPIDIKNIKLHGGGGTNINPVIDWLNDNKPEIAIIFTDGYFSSPRTEYKGDLIWLIYDNPNFECDFGTIIHFD